MARTTSSIASRTIDPATGSLVVVAGECVAYDDLALLPCGARVRVAGRELTMAAGCVSFYGEHSEGGVRSIFPVFTGGKLTTATFRPATKVVAVAA